VLFRGLTLSYGLKVFNGANRVIIDGESSTFQTLQVSSTISQVAGALSSGALVMGTRHTTGVVGGQTSGSTFTPVSGTYWTTLAKTSGLTGIQNTNVPSGADGDYGLQVRNASNVLCYDSRLHSNGLGMSLSNIYPAASLTGGNVATTATLTQNLIDQGAVKGSILAQGFSTSNPPYVSLNTSFTNDFIFGGTGNIYWSSFYFDYTTNGANDGILYFLNGGYINISGEGFSLAGYFSIPNFSTVLVANVLS